MLSTLKLLTATPSASVQAVRYLAAQTCLAQPGL